MRVFHVGIDGAGLKGDPVVAPGFSQQGARFPDGGCNNHLQHTFVSNRLELFPEGEGANFQ